jgi:hypothetical protein
MRFPVLIQENAYFFTYKSSAQEFDANPDQQIGCAPADTQLNDLSIFTRKMNLTEAQLAHLADVEATREFLIATLIALVLGAAAFIYLFNGVGESDEPCNLIVSRLDVLLRYWPILIFATIIYIAYQVIEFIALHTCCRPQQPVIIARPLDKVP